MNESQSTSEFVKSSMKLQGSKKEEIAKAFEQMEEESVKAIKEDIQNNNPIDVGFIVGGLDSGKPIEFYMHPMAGSIFWCGVVEGLRQQGYSYDEIVSTLKSKSVRRAFDIHEEIEEGLYKLGKEASKHI